MTRHRFALVLHPSVPQEFLALMAGYIRKTRSLTYLACDGIEHLGSFVLASVVGKNNKHPWPIQVPVGYVIAIADMSKPRAGLGFLSDSQ